MAPREPTIEVHRHPTEIASSAPEADVAVGSHQVLGGTQSRPHPQSRQHSIRGVDQCAGVWGRRQVMNNNEARMPRAYSSSLGPIPPVPRPTQNEMKVRTGKFLLEILGPPIVLDPGVREAISSLRAHS